MILSLNSLFFASTPLNPLYESIKTLFYNDKKIRIYFYKLYLVGTPLLGDFLSVVLNLIKTIKIAS